MIDLASRIYGWFRVPGGVPSCDRERFPLLGRPEIRRIVSGKGSGIPNVIQVKPNGCWKCWKACLIFILSSPPNPSSVAMPLIKSSPAAGKFPLKTP